MISGDIYGDDVLVKYAVKSRSQGTRAPSRAAAQNTATGSSGLTCRYIELVEKAMARHPCASTCSTEVNATDRGNAQQKVRSAQFTMPVKSAGRSTDGSIGVTPVVCNNNNHWARCQLVIMTALSATTMPGGLSLHPAIAVTGSSVGRGLVITSFGVANISIPITPAGCSLSSTWWRSLSHSDPQRLNQPLTMLVSSRVIRGKFVAGYAVAVAVCCSAATIAVSARFWRCGQSVSRRANFAAIAQRTSATALGLDNCNQRADWRIAVVVMTLLCLLADPWQRIDGVGGARYPVSTCR